MAPAHDKGGELAATDTRHGTEPTHHFIIDFVEMNFTDFFHHVFIFKSYEAKSCLIKKQKGERERKILVRLNNVISVKHHLAFGTLENFHKNMHV